MTNRRVCVALFEIVRNSFWNSWITARLVLAHVDLGGVGMRRRHVLLPWLNEARPPLALAIPACVWNHSRHPYPAERVCGGVGRSRCGKDICHNMCDLLAVCHPLWSGEPQPILLPKPQILNRHTSVGLVTSRGSVMIDNCWFTLWHTNKSRMMTFEISLSIRLFA